MAPEEEAAWRKAVSVCPSAGLSGPNGPPFHYIPHGPCKGWPLTGYLAYQKTPHSEPLLFSLLTSPGELPAYLERIPRAMVSVGGSQWDQMVASYTLLGYAMNLKNQGHFGTKEPQSCIHPWDQQALVVEKKH